MSEYIVSFRGWVEGEPIVRCRDCKYFKESFWACNNDRLVEANGAVFLSVDPDGFCSQAKPKEEA